MSETAKPAMTTSDGNQANARLASKDGDFPATPKEPLPADELLYDLADLFKVFSDTTRIKLLYALMDDGLCVAQLAETVGASTSAVSHQLRTLKQARLVKARRDGKNVIYSLADGHVHSILEQGMDHVCE